MAFDTDPTTMSRDETYDLISSEKVDGTAVYNRAGDKLGTVNHFTEPSPPLQLTVAGVDEV